MKRKKRFNDKTPASAARILDILEFIVSKDNIETNINEISSIFKLSKTTSYRMLKYLYERGYLDHNIKSSVYSLGFKLIEIGWMAITKQPLTKIASPYLEKLTQKTGESSILGILKDNEVFYLEKFGGKGLLKIDVEVETHAPIHCTAQGKILLAWLTKNQINNIISKLKFEKYTIKTITNKDLFIKELEKTKEKGYAISDEEYVLGTCAIAVPIINKQEKIIASLALVVPKARFDENKIYELRKSLFEAKNGIEKKLVNFINYF